MLEVDCLVQLNFTLNDLFKPLLSEYRLSRPTVDSVITSSTIHIYFTTQDNICHILILVQRLLTHTLTCVLVCWSQIHSTRPLGMTKTIKNTHIKHISMALRVLAVQ